jgi:hypothetical protein
MSHAGPSPLAGQHPVPPVTQQVHGGMDTGQQQLQKPLHVSPLELDELEAPEEDELLLDEDEELLEDELLLEEEELLLEDEAAPLDEEDEPPEEDPEPPLDEELLLEGGQRQ